MNLQVLALIGVVAVAPGSVIGQAVAPAIDSAGISGAIAAHLLTESGSHSVGVLAIDTSGNRWNTLVYRGLMERDPKLVPPMSDSVAHYATHFSVNAFAMGPDSVSASVTWSGCYNRESSSFTRLTWVVARERAGWVIHQSDAVMTGHGICPPYKAGGAR